jgi:antitoxin (DNA-binding transcriptional repressor) of toxin-antitoxin stability system
MQVNMLEAKNRLSSLIAAVENDEEVIIARNGVAIAQIVKYTRPKIAAPGSWKHKTSYSTEWNSPATNTDIEKLFHGSGNETIA